MAEQTRQDGGASALQRPLIADSVLDLVGRTPLVRLTKVVPTGAAEVLGKWEVANPAGSVKDRIARSMVEAAERDGTLKPGATLIEATSGNTGIGLAMVCATKGYHLVLTMPEDYSVERRRLLERLGAKLVLTPAIEGMTGAVYAAEGLVKRRGYVMVQQFDNPANPEAHRQTTGPEILEGTGGRLDAFVAGVGTGVRSLVWVRCCAARASRCGSWLSSRPVRRCCRAVALASTASRASEPRSCRASSTVRSTTRC